METQARTGKERPPSPWTYHGGGVCSKGRADGKRVYFVKYRRNGKPIVERVGLDEQKAHDRANARRDQRTDPAWVPPPVKRKEARQAEQETRAAAAVAEKPANTMADLIAIYRRECMKAKRREDWQTWMLGIVEAELGALALSDVTPERLEAWRDRLISESKSPSTVRKYVYFVSGIYADTMRTAGGRKLVQDNPCRLVALPAEPVGLRKALSAEQAGVLLNACRDDAAIYRWARLVLSTGMRVEEASGLTWGDAALEWDGEELRSVRFAVHETKTGRPRYVEASEQMLPDLAAWWKDDSPHPKEVLIGESFETLPYARWRAVFDAAGIPWGTEHDQFTTRNLRTTFCMLAFQNGARPEELVQQTGHSMETLFEYYAEASRDQRKRAVNAFPDLKRAALRSVAK